MSLNINQWLKNHPRAYRYGAPLGAREFVGTTKVYLQRLRFVDGDYTLDGTYWGRTPGEYVYCAMAEDETTRVYVRAKSREGAKQKLADYGFTYYH